MAGNDEQTLRTQEDMRDVQMDVSNMRTMMAYDRQTLYRLKRVIRNLNETFGSSHSNKIPSVPNGDPTHIPDNSGDSPKLDHFASNLEEKDNHIGHNLVAFIKKEKKMHEKVDNFHRRFLEYDAEMSKMYAMFFNLSLQISSLENRLLTHEKHQFEHDLTELQRSFFNFTQQIFNLEQWRVSSKTHYNTTVQNRNEISEVTGMVKNHQMRIKTLEQLILENRSMANQNLMVTQTHLGTLNETIQVLY